MFFLPLTVLKKNRKSLLQRYKRYNPYPIRVTVVALLSHGSTFNTAQERVLENKNTKPIENTTRE